MGKRPHIGMQTGPKQIIQSCLKVESEGRVELGLSTVIEDDGIKKTTPMYISIIMQ